MALLAWNEGLSVAVPQMDAEHKKLIGLVNQLNEAMKVGKSKEELGSILRGLIQYTQTHFTSEERFMRDVGYPQLDEQMTEHAALLAQVTDFKEQFESGKTMLSISLMNFLSAWVSNHIQCSDKKYGIWAQEHVGA